MSYEYKKIQPKSLCLVFAILLRARLLFFSVLEPLGGDSFFASGFVFAAGCFARGLSRASSLAVWGVDPASSSLARTLAISSFFAFDLGLVLPVPLAAAGGGMAGVTGAALEARGEAVKVAAVGAVEVAAVACGGVTGAASAVATSVAAAVGVAAAADA